VPAGTRGFAECKTIAGRSESGQTVAMGLRKIYDREGHAQFITFSCYRRRRLLDHDGPKRIVLGILNGQLLKHSGRCIGFVLMPDHVHAIIWLPTADCLSEFMKQWKRLSSLRIRQFSESHTEKYAAKIDKTPIWQAKYYAFNLYSRRKLEEKLGYMHENPVRAGLVTCPCEWRWSSARYYELGKSVGVKVGWLD
jgi:putative transposase